MTTENEDILQTPNDMRNDINAQLRIVNNQITHVEQTLHTALEWLHGELTNILNRLSISRGRGKVSFDENVIIGQKGNTIDVLVAQLHTLQIERDLLNRVKDQLKLVQAYEDSIAIPPMPAMPLAANN